jgi:hypothetical protein
VSRRVAFKHVVSRRVAFKLHWFNDSLLNSVFPLEVSFIHILHCFLPLEKDIDGFSMLHFKQVEVISFITFLV